MMRWGALAAVVFAVAACSPPVVGACDENRQCGASQICVDHQCASAPVDAGSGKDAGADAGTPDAGSGDGGTADGGATLDGGTGADGGQSCFDDLDCPSATLFFCNTTTSLCEPSCATKADCTAAVRGPHALPTCDLNPLGCQCDEGQCAPALCTADSECGTMVCRNGVCVNPPAASTIARCDVVPAVAVFAAGAKHRFSVLAQDAAGNPIIPAAGAVWSAVDVSVTGSGTGSSQDFTAAAGAGPIGPVDGVQAAFGTITCRAKVFVHRATIPADTIDVTVVDVQTGRPVSAATILVSNPSTGASIGGLGTTDGRGHVQAAVPAGTTSVTVSAFHAEFDYQTIAAYDLTTGSRSVVLAVRRNPLDRLGGAKGKFTPLPMSMRVHMGSAGVGQASFVEPRLLAPPIPTRVKIGTAIDQMNVPLAAASTLAFADQPIKTEYVVPASNGTCHLATGLLDETAIALGACGTSTVFGLTADVPLGDLPVDAIAGGTTNVDWIKVVQRAVPLYRYFASSLRRDVEHPLPVTQTAPDGGWVLDATTNHTVTDLPFAQLPLSQVFAVQSPDLPKLQGVYAPIVFLRGVANVPGRGLVELGIGSGINTTPADAKVDVTTNLLTPGLVQLRMAPTHHGLEGAEYAVMATATSKDLEGGAAEGSSVVARLPQNRLAFDPKGLVPVQFPTGYLGFPEGARYNFTDAAQGALPARTFRFTTPPAIGSATVVQVTFADRKGRRWVVLSSPTAAPLGFVLPKPAGGFSDRTFFDGAATGERSTLRVDALAFLNTTAIGFTRWMELGAGNPSRALDFTTAASFIDYGRPTISWLTPMANGTTIAPGSTVSVQVRHFAVPADGSVRLTFAGGTNCAAAIGNVDAGLGKVNLVVPVGCSGANVQLTATLVDPASAALAPPVTASLTAAIQ